MMAEGVKNERHAGGRWKYVDDYEFDSAGGCVYKGDYYCYDMPPQKLVRMKIIYAVLALFSAAAYVSMGFLNVGSSRVLYVALPYAAMFLPMAFMGADVFKIITAKEKMTQKAYNHSVVQLKGVTIAVMILAGLSLAGDVLFLAINGIYAMNNEIIYILGCLLIVAVNIVFLHLQRKFPCTRVKR